MDSGLLLQTSFGQIFWNAVQTLVIELQYISVSLLHTSFVADMFTWAAMGSRSGMRTEQMTGTKTISVLLNGELLRKNVLPQHNN